MHYLTRVVLIIVCLTVLAVPFSVAQENAYVLFLITVDGKRGFIDRNGKIVIPPTFEDLQEFKDGRAPAKVSGKWGFIDRSGKFVIEPKFDEIRWSFSEGLTPVLVGEKWGYIDQTGKFVIQPDLEYGHSFEAGRAVINIGKNSDLRHGIINKTGKLVTAQKFEWSGWEYSEGLLNVKVDGKWGFIDHDGKFIIPAKFNDAREFSDGLAAVEFSKEKNQWGYIDKSGDVIIPAQFEDAGYFKEGFAPIRKDLEVRVHK